MTNTMINITTFKNIKEIFDTHFIVNIFLHVTILFTILAHFFMYYISSISSDAINNELKSVINDSFKELQEHKSLINNKITNLKEQYSNLIEQYKNNASLLEQTEIINSKLNDISLQISNLQFLSRSLPVPINSNSLHAFLLPNLNDISKYINNLSFDYYLNLFSKNTKTRELVNEQVFSKIKITNYLLILFFVIFVGTLNLAGVLTMEEFGELLLENIITFLFVGIVEVIFFLNIALKYVPLPPSLIFTSFIDALKNK
jgi:hypothetical protein